MTSLQEQLIQLRPLLKTAHQATSPEPFKPTVKVDFVNPDSKYEVVYDLDQETNVASAFTYQQQQSQPQQQRQETKGGWNGRDRRASSPPTPKPYVQFSMGDDAKVHVPLTEDKVDKYLAKMDKQMSRDERSANLDTATRIVTLILGVLSIGAAGAAIAQGLKSKSQGDPRS